MPIFRQNGQLWLFRSKFAQKWILGLKIQKTNVGIRASILEIPCVPIFIKNGQLWVFGPKFSQKWILGSRFQKSKSRFRITASKILCELIFSQNGRLWIFRPIFGEIVQLHYVGYFGSNIVEGVAESWVEAEMSWVEVGVARRRLKWADWR